MAALRAFATGLVLFLSACAPFAQSPTAPAHVPRASEADVNLRRLLADSDEASLDRNPLDSLYRGDRRRVTRFGDQLSDAHVSATRAAAQVELERLAAIDRDQLSSAGRVAYDTFRWNKTLELRRYEPTLTDVWLRLPLNSYFESWHLEFPSISSGDSIAPFRTVADYDDGLSRIDGFVTFLDLAIVRLREGAAHGVVQPRLVVEYMIDQFDEFIAQGVDRSPFYRTITKLPADMPLSDRNRLTQLYAAAVRERVLPAFVRVREFLKTEYLPMSRTTVGLSHIPGGAIYYRLPIEEHT